MAERELYLEMRTDTGKEFAGKIRRQGKIPAVFYGRGKQPSAVLVDTGEALKILHSRTGKNTILTVKSEDQELAGRRALIRESQTDAITDQLLHIDLMEVDKDRPLRVSIPVEITGKPIGLEKGGTLEEHIREIEIFSLPDEIPEQIKIEVSQLDLGDSIHIRDLKLEKFKVLGNPNLAVVSVVAPSKIEEEAAPAAAVEGEAVPGVEGEAVPGAEAGAEAGAKPGEKGAAKLGEKGAAKPGEKVVAKPGEKAGAKPGEKAGAKSEAKAEPARSKGKKPAKS